MSYKRTDRKDDETRPIEAKAGIIKNATGSAMFRIGKTVAYAAVYGPKPVVPKFMSSPKEGILRCNYQMMPFSGMGERIRPGQNRRAKEISMVTENSLRQVLDLSQFANSVVDVVIQIPEADAGTRCAGISAAAIALADAGLTMKEMVAGVAVGRVSDKVVVDLDYAEEAHEEGAADVPIAVTSKSGKISLLQIDGEITQKDLKKALEMGVKACKKIDEVQRKALKEKYQ